ncbi:MAG TPA: DUF502 domain-containing protein [Caulobacterales bacterium]|jgi:uncharacterized membrane protein|nr:DUF502 domain-containing protein [Caulobacterales bacterium]
MTDDSSAPAPPARFSPWEWFRNSFAAGVAVVLPFAVTFWIIWSFVSFVDQRVVPFLPEPWQGYANAIPGIGVVIAVVGLTLLGALAANLIGGVIVHWSERLLARVPLVRTIYGGSKQIFSQVASPERTSFHEAVLVEFPRPGLWMIGFVTSDAPGIAALDPDMVAIYVPHAPVPASGFVIYVSRAQLKPLGMPAEEALKRILSLGLIKDSQ